MRKPHTYWDEGIELVPGCTPCSQGCRYCWSAGMTHRFGDAALTYIDPEYEVPRFTGKVVFHPDRLTRFNKKKPTVFSIWNDLFHEDVAEDFVKQSLGAAHQANQHTFLILTKRPQRIIDYYSWCGECVPGSCASLVTLEVLDTYPNIYFGLTVCNQQEADEKIPIFLQIPGKKFLSIEPMLGNINLAKFGIPDYMGDNSLSGHTITVYRFPIDAVILGCETGSNARPISLESVRCVVRQCEEMNVPLFIKALTINGKPNHNIEQWPEDLRIRELAW